ncbi:rCG59247, isoform CRA_e, partial [Rattus norvegicus]
MCTCPWCFLLIRRILWLSIRGKEADIWSMFHFSTPLPQLLHHNRDRQSLEIGQRGRFLVEEHTLAPMARDLRPVCGPASYLQNNKHRLNRT